MQRKPAPLHPVFPLPCIPLETGSLKIITSKKKRNETERSKRSNSIPIRARRNQDHDKY